MYWGQRLRHARLQDTRRNIHPILPAPRLPSYLTTITTTIVAQSSSWSGHPITACSNMMMGIGGENGNGGNYQSRANYSCIT